MESEPDDRLVVQIMTTWITDAGGAAFAHVERVTIGGGMRNVGTIDGQPVERADPTTYRYHVRFLSPDRMIPDELREAETYDEAVELALKWGRRRLEHAARVGDLAEALRI